MKSCREIEPLLVAEPDGTLNAAGLARLEDHVATCSACRRQRAALAHLHAQLRTPVREPDAADAATAWQALRPRMSRSAPRRRPIASWSTVTPLATATAFALALWWGAPGPAPVAHAQYVEVHADASTMVYVDQPSGWLIVWASEPG